MVSCVLVQSILQSDLPAQLSILYNYNQKKIKVMRWFLKTKKKLINLIKTIRYFTVGFLAERTA